MSGDAADAVKVRNQSDETALQDEQRHRRRALDVQRDRRWAELDLNDALQRRMQSSTPPKAVKRNQMDTATLRPVQQHKRMVSRGPNKTQQHRIQTPARVTRHDKGRVEADLDWDWLRRTPSTSSVTKQGMKKADADPLDTIPSMINWDGLMIFSGYSVNGKPLSMSDAELV